MEDRKQEVEKKIEQNTKQKENTQTKKCVKMEDKNFNGKYEKRRNHVMG